MRGRKSIVHSTTFLITLIFAYACADDSATNIRTALHDNRVFEGDSAYDFLKESFINGQKIKAPTFYFSDDTLDSIILFLCRGAYNWYRGKTVNPIITRCNCAQLLDRMMADEDWMFWATDDLRKWYTCCHYCARGYYTLADSLNRHQEGWCLRIQEFFGDKKEIRKSLIRDTRKAKVMGDILTRMEQEMSAVLSARHEDDEKLFSTSSSQTDSHDHCTSV